MLFSLLVTAREGLEIALIVTILLGYLRSIGQKRHFREIWYGVGLAAALCVAFGAGLEIASREMNDEVMEAFEGFTMLFAVGVLTWMLFWMKRQSSGMSRELRQQMEGALSRGSMFALTLLAFSAVGREGFETSLFLFAGSTNQTSGLAFVSGGILGFVLAAGVGVVIYYGFARLPLKQFFLASAIVLMFLAAGLVSNALTSLHNSALITNLGSRPWDTDSYLSMTSSLGKLLHAVLGYDSAPALSQLVAYWGYLLVVATAYLGPPAALRRLFSGQKAEPATAAAEARTSN